MENCNAFYYTMKYTAFQQVLYIVERSVMSLCPSWKTANIRDKEIGGTWYAVS